MNNELPFTTQVPAVNLTPGDLMLLPSVLGSNIVDLIPVTDVEVVGDDVEVNGGSFTTSLSNKVTLLVT